MRALSLVAMLVPGLLAAQQDQVTFRQEALGVEVSAPTTWQVQRIRIADPLEEFRRGEFSFTMSSMPGPDAPDWNALVFNAGQQGGGTPLPFVRVSVHPADGEVMDALPSLFEATLERMQVPLTTRNRAFRVGEATGADYLYNLMATVRYAVLSAHGKRVVVMAYVPAADATAWTAAAPAIETLVQSIRIR